MKTITALVLIFMSLSITCALTNTARADQSESIMITTKINVCGDDAAEGPEECDNLDLKGETCKSLGFSGGVLTCDLACDFDKSGCFFKTLIETTTSTSDKEDAQNNLRPQITQIKDQQETSTPTLPRGIERYDTNNNGRLDVSEIYDIAKAWVDNLRQSDVGINPTCDVNSDGRCNLIDFSVLMYYVDQ